VACRQMMTVFPPCTHCRFSTALTKDLLFVGLRDLLRKVGEAIAANSELKIGFSVGHMLVKERKIDFDFDHVILAPVRVPDARHSIALGPGPAVNNLHPACVGIIRQRSAS
jgi:hypothetical protein